MAKTRQEITGSIEALYREDGQRLWQAVYVYSGNKEVADDAVAEAFAQLLRRGEHVREPSRWVWRAAFAIARGELQRLRTLQPSQDRAVLAAEPSVLMASLARLSPAQRGAIVLHYVVGLRLREIATLTGTSKATVGVHLSRGRRRLAQLLEEHDED